MKKLNELIEQLLFFIFTIFLFFLFLINLPLFQEPHGFFIMNELSEFSSRQLAPGSLFGSLIVCIGLGVLVMKWIPTFTPGMAANLWGTTFFLMWVDSMFALSIQSQSFHYLILLALGLLFLYLFFFTLYYLDLPKDPIQESKEQPRKYNVINYWLGVWMVFYMIVSVRLLFNSFGYPELQWPLAMGFCALCFLNYLLFLFLKRSNGQDIAGLSRAGRLFFSFWFLALLCTGISQRYFH